MSDRSENPEDLAAARALIGALCEDRLTPEQAAELEDLVRHSSEIRRMYIRLMHLHAGLYQHAALLGERVIDLDAEASSSAGLEDAMVMPALTVEATEERPLVVREPATLPVPSWRMPRIAAGRLRRTAWRAAAALVVLGLGLVVAVVLHHAGTGRGPVQTAAGSVATFSQGFDAEWADDPAPVVGADLSADREYSLRAGYARMTFSGGVVVVVEGPARFSAHSSAEMNLKAGKLSAVVPGGANGFAVRTPAATVVDLGTEFGVGASEAGTDVQVYRGKVSLAPVASVGAAASGPAARAAQVMNQGEARRVDATGAVSTVAADPAAFVRSAQFDGWAKAAPAAPQPMQRWRAYSERLRRDSDLAVYYTFERHADGPTRLQNEALHTAGRFEIPLGLDAPTWVQGRWAAKDALAFDASRHQRLLLGDYPLSDNGKLTVTVWIYLNRRTTWASIAKNRGSKKGGQFAMGLCGDDGDLVARAFCGDGSEVEVREGKSSPLPVHRWVHVAMVADGSALRLFHNGKEVASWVCKPLAPNPSVRSLAIGFRTDDDGTTPLAAANAENWDGSFDELAVFHRALTSEQVREMYEAGKP
jgi:hypothetical protein